MRLILDRRARRLLRRVPAVSFYTAGELLLLLALAVQGARLVWAIVTPVGPLGDWRPAAPVAAGLPADTLASFDPFFRLDGDAAGPAAVTSLQLTLFGTRLDEAQGGGSAIVAGPDGVQQAVVVGQEVAPGVRLRAVAFDHVTLERGGRPEDLFIDQSKAVQPVSVPAIGAPPPPGAAPPLAPGAVPASAVRGEIGFVPRLDGGRVEGLVVRPQGTGTLFRQAGLHDGDVVTAIAGRPVSDASELDRLATDYRAGGAVPLTVDRGGQTLQLSLVVAPQP